MFTLVVAIVSGQTVSPSRLTAKYYLNIYLQRTLRDCQGW